MDNEARLMAALAAGGAPRRDPAFTMAVMRAAEAKRYRAATIRSMLKVAGLAAAAASLALPFAGWAGANLDALREGILGAAGLLVLVGATRLLSARATAILRH
ncbi:MAG: hypothetical protein ACREH4_05730 [Vitreimonas sp.]